MGSLDTDARFLLTFLLMKLLIFASISSLETMILLKVLQSQNCFTKSELRQLLHLATKREKAFAPSLSVLRNIFAN